MSEVREREQGYVRDSTRRKVAEREARAARPVVGKHRVGQRVRLDVGEHGQPWGVILALEIDKARLRLDGGGIIVVPRTLLRAAATR